MNPVPNMPLFPCAGARERSRGGHSSWVASPWSLSAHHAGRGFTHDPFPFPAIVSRPGRAAESGRGPGSHGPAHGPDLAPSIVLTVTSFTRIIIVFHFLHMGTQQMPPNQVLSGLAIFMTVVIMAPLGKTMNAVALQPYLKEEIGYREALERAEQPLRSFLFKHTREKDLSVSFSISGIERPKKQGRCPDHAACSGLHDQ